MPDDGEIGLVQQIVDRYYPAAMKIAQVISYSHSVFRVSIPTGDRMIKVGKASAQIALSKEALVLSLLTNQGVPAPVIEHSDFSGVQFQRPWLSMQSLGETSMIQLVAERNVSLPELFQQLGVVLGKIHEVVPAKIRRAELISSLRRDFTGQVEKLNFLAGRLAESGIVERDAVMRFAKVQYPDPSGDRLCHGCFHTG